jgi:urease accessory protein
MRDGHGVLEVEQVGAASVVTRSAARPPLQVLVPKNHGGAVWAYLSNLGGGLVDGDDLALETRVGAGAAALLATQASTKVYRSPRGCRQRVVCHVGAGGLLVVVPDPVVCFADARLDQETVVHLADGASLLLVDAVTAGRAARGERWAFASYRSAFSVHLGGELLLHDAVELDAGHGRLDERMGRWGAVATVVAIGARAPALAETSSIPGGDWAAARSPLSEGTLVRAAATSAERLHLGLRELLAALPHTLGDDPFARKW